MESTRDWGGTLNFVPHQIIDEMSQSLTRMVTYEEVKHVAFQIRGSCVPGSDMFIGLFYHRL